MAHNVQVISKIFTKQSKQMNGTQTITHVIRGT